MKQKKRSRRVMGSAASCRN